MIVIEHPRHSVTLVIGAQELVLARVVFIAQSFIFVTMLGCWLVMLASRFSMRCLQCNSYQLNAILIQRQAEHTVSTNMQKI